MSFRSALKFFFAFFIALAITAPPHVLAQAPAGGTVATGATVRGLVADPDNAVIPGATVTLTPQSGKALTAVSGSDGNYVIRGVPAGNYSITVTMDGFASFVKEGVASPPDRLSRWMRSSPSRPRHRRSRSLPTPRNSASTLTATPARQ